jgi:MFS family permease
MSAYYAANAAGRLIGIVLSGALAQYGGLSACLWGSAIMLAICLLLTFLLPAGSETRRRVAATADLAGGARPSFQDFSKCQLKDGRRPPNFDDS